MKMPKKSLGKKTILAIHGLEPDVDILKSRIEESGYRFLEATDGRDGIEVVRKKSAHLILLSSSLPDMSGLNLCKLLKKESFSSSIPIIYISDSLTVTSEQEQAKRCGADEFFYKSDLCSTKLYDHPIFISTIRFVLGEIDQSLKESINKETLLLLTNKIESLENLRSNLYESGFALITSVSGIETLDILRSSLSVSCVVIDLEEFDLRGTNIINQLATFERELAIVGMISNSDETRSC